MDHVGGDFYDFIQFRDSRKIGIFLSDVSGHGVPAAFITSMIKSILLQMGDGRDDPAALLTHLNGMLCDRTGGNFVTAFYGVYDPGERRIIYSVAGHTLPYVIENDSISMLDGTGGIPLAILDNQEMRSRKKGYVNSEKTLAKHSKLILYTDGLTEAVNISNTGEMFDETMIGTVFREIKNLPGRDFVRILFQRLVAFRGSSSFDDDVCLICLDV
jgi:sigma-B regulation protein RsbU (phosphoserine phosphatase)